VTAAGEARRPYRIGVLSEAWSANHPTVEGLKAGLKDLGLVEGRDVTFDIRFTEGQRADMFNVATALVVGGVDLIFTSGEPATRAAADASQKIPIVFTQVGDPVSGNIRKSWVYARENITGVSSLTTRLVPKRLEVLKTLAPTLRRVWAIYPAAEGSALATVREATEAAPRLKLEVVGRPAWTPEDVDRDLRSVRQGDGLLVPDITIMDIPVRILEKSVASRLPAVFPSTLWVEHGGLVSYGADYRGEGLQAARLVAKILRGARPQDLPIEGAEKIDLAVNLKTAALLGLNVPRKVLLRAEWILR
jgi:putative ABC transport system substrate-binding protein